MITCAKCKKESHIEWRNISKDSTIPCLHCGNECLVTLFDLEATSSHKNQGFSGISDSHTEIQTEAIENAVIPHHHFLMIMLFLNSFVILFILGMSNIEYLEEEFPIVGRFYNSIKVFARKTISISSITVEEDDQIMTVTLNLLNLSDQSELVNDVQVLIMDPFNNAIAGTHIKPHQIVNSSKSISLKINIAEKKDISKKICVFINGKIILEKSLPITP